MNRLQHTLQTRLTAMFLALICLFSLLPVPTSAAGPSTIKLDRFGLSGVTYESASLGRCLIHQMYYDYDGKSTIGFCGTKGATMNQSLTGQTWGNPQAISDPTVEMMMADYYAHSTNNFTDQAHALGVDDVWDSGYTWYMNAWVQAIVWRYKAGTLSDPVVACAEELMAVFNSLEGTHFTSIDQEKDGTSFRSRAQYILDLGRQGVWGNCSVQEYTFTGAAAGNVQKIMIGTLDSPMTEDKYALTIKKVDSTNPTKGLQGAKFHVEAVNGSYNKEIVTGPDGTYTLENLDANTYAVTETAPPPGGYEIDNPGPEYVVLPNGSSNTVTVTFTDTPPSTGEGTIRKVDVDDPSKGLAEAVIKITGVDNNFVGTYTTGAGGYLTDVPWDQMPVGSYTAEEVTPPEGYTKSPDVNKTKQTFVWDGQTDISLIFENDAHVKIRLIKLDDSNNPLPGAVFNILRDGQIIGTEATKTDGTITVTDVTEGMYAFVEVSAPTPFARLTEPVIAHVDQATINGGGTVTVTASDKRLPNLTILKRDAQTQDPVPGTVFEVRGIHFHYHEDVETGPDGKAVLSNLPVDSYEVREKSVPDPYVIGDEPVQTIYLGPGENRELIFDNLKQPLLTISKVDAVTGRPVPGTILTIEGIDSDYKHDVTTGADGTVSLRLAPGSFKITEKSVPSPYYLPDKDADRVQTISLNAGDEKTVVFKNHRMPEVTVYKENSITREPIEHAKFHITYTSNGESADAPSTIDYGYFFTDVKGEIRLHEQGKRLYPGEFTITEVEPADGFQLKEPITQKVILHGSESKTVVFQNTPLSALVVWKYDSVTGEPVEGAVFQVRYMSGTSGSGGTVIGTYKTGPGGSFTINRLKAGAYTVEELASDGSHVIDTAPQTAYISGEEQAVVQLYFGNSPKGSLLVKKIDAATHEPLSDVEFLVTDSHGTMLGDANGKFVTDSAGTILISNINPGTTLVVRETRTRENYILDDVPQTATIQAGQTVSLEFRNQPKGSVTLYKFSSLDRRTPLEGVGFKITFADGKVVDNIGGKLSSNGIYYTDSEGQINISGVTGTLVFTEISTIPGYLIDENRKSQTIMVNPNDHQSVYFYNQPIGSIVVKKMSSSTKEPLSDVIIRITRTDGTVVGESNGEFRTDENGFIKVDVEPGSYIVQEVKAKSGFLLDDTPKTIEVKGSGTYNIELFNQPLGSLVIHKYSSLDRKTPLAGVQFKLTYAPGCVVDDENGKVSSNGIYYTELDGTITINGIVGTVIITEQATIPGYTIDPETRSQTIVVNPDDVQHAYFYNTPKNTLILEKYLETETGNEPLKGVTFLVTDSSGAVIGNSNGEYVSGDDGRVVISGVEPGTTITVREIKVPEGVVLDGIPKTIKISADGANILRFYNKKIGTLVVRKLDKISKEPLPGVQFELTYAEGGYVDDAYGHLSSKGLYTTNANGEIRVPVVGTIVVKEVKTLSTHVIDEATRIQTVTVNPADTQTLVVYNEPLCSLTLTKLDAVTGKPIPNTEFTLKDGDGNIIGRYTTGADGTVTVTGLVPNSTVVVVETKVPSNYVLDPTPRTIIVRNGSNTLSGAGGSSGIVNGGSSGGSSSGNSGGNNITVENIPKTTLTIEKYLETETGDRPLKGVTFLVTDSSGAVVGSSNGEYTTDENGRIVIPNLEPGITVTAKEIRVPDGVVLDSTPKSIEIKGGEGGQTLRFVNKATGYLVIKKLDKMTNEPLAGVEFKLTYASGEYVDDAYGHLSSLGLYRTDQNGEIRIPVVGTVVIEETKTLPNYIIDEGTKRQVVTVNPADTQTVTVYNTPIGGLELIKVNEADKTQRIPNTTFEIRRMDGGLVDTVITGDNGRVHVELDAGNYYAVEIEAAKGFQVDNTPHYFTIEDGKTTTLTVTNRAFSGILIHKIDSASKIGIYGVTFLLYDADKKPIGQYSSDDRGYVYIDDLPGSGRYYLRELENDGYLVDTQLKTVYVTDGTTTEITWENTAITGQIQITKTSEDYNSMNGWPAGTPIPGTEFEIYHYRTGNLVDTIRTDKNGAAVSKPLPLGRYKIVESKAADFYGLDKTPIEVEIEYAGQIVKAAMTNKALYTNVSIKKTGFVEVMPGQQIRYDFSGIANNSTTVLTSFFWRDTLPTALRLDKIVTGTYNVQGNYKIVFKTNLNGEYRTMYDNLNTQQNNVLDASPAALGLASNEYVTEFMVSFGVVPGNFRQVEAPRVYCSVVSWLNGGTQFVNQADVGGVYNGQWIMAASRWVTRVYKPSKPLPRTGY